MIAELVEVGYAQKEQARDGGRFGALSLVIYDEPLSPDQSQEEGVAFLPQTEKPSTVNPSTEKPAPVNPPLVITDNLENTDHSLEREARESEQAGEETLASDDSSKFERRVKRIAARTRWTGWEKSSTDWTVGQFSKLTDAERAEAEAMAEIYVGHCKGKPVALGVYFRDRKWTDLPDDVVRAAVVAEGPRKFEPVFGPVHGAMRILALLEGPIDNIPLPQSKFLRDTLLRDDELGERSRRDHRMKNGYPAVNRMDDAGVPNTDDRAHERNRLLKELMEPVVVGTDLWREWQEYHDRREWLWIPDRGQRAVYFPKGGPDGLNDFAAAVAAMQGAEGKAC